MRGSPTGLRQHRPACAFSRCDERQGATPRSACLRFLESQFAKRRCFGPAVHSRADARRLHRRSSTRSCRSRRPKGWHAVSPNAKLCVLPGTDHYIWSGDVVPIIDAIEEFLPGYGGVSRSERTTPCIGVVRRHRRVGRHGDHLGRRAHEHDARFLRRHRAPMRCAGDRRSRQEPRRRVPRRVRRPRVRRMAAVASRARSAASASTCAPACTWRRSNDAVNDVAGRGVSLGAVPSTRPTPGEVWVTCTVTDLVAGGGLDLRTPRRPHPQGLPRPRHPPRRSRRLIPSSSHGRRPDPRRNSTAA